MKYQYSTFGHKFTASSGIVDLMDDLGSALQNNPDMLMLGGGTPARVSEAEAIYSQHLQQMLNDSEQAYQMLGRYQGPQGDEEVRDLLAQLLNAEYGWQLSRDNVAVTNGGQSAFGVLANMLAGDMADGSVRRIHFPVLPEYLGYADAGFSSNFFSATLPAIEMIGERRFKYHVDFDELGKAQGIGAYCLSRPTNPTGNVLTEAELQALDAQARKQGFPLIIDAAYGLPFPGLHYGNSSAYWSDNVILMLSLSKLGLPGLRSGFLVADADFIAAFSRANTIMNLASGNVGPALAADLMRSGDMLKVSKDILNPWYQQKRQLAEQVLLEALTGLPCRMHVAEGAFFLWLWCQDLPVSTSELYQRLKQAGVIVIPGDTSFPGLQQDWQHSRECIRLSYAVPEATLVKAAAIIGDELRRLYQG